MSQALNIEQILEQTILDPSTPAASRASCAAAWTRVQEAKRILQGKPLPGQLRPDLQDKRRKPQAPWRPTNVTVVTAKESLLQPPTVPAPPPRGGPNGAESSPS